MKIGSPPMASAVLPSKTWSWNFMVVLLALFFGNVAFGLSLQIPSRPNSFPLQVLETNGPLHPVVWGATNNRQADVPANLTNAVQVASSPSSYHNVALLDNGTVVAWGKTNNGRCAVPRNLTNVVQVAAGGSHSLALKSDGSVVGWGLGSDGQTNVPADLGRAVQIEAGYTHSLALLADGSVSAWGDSSYGQCDVPPGLSNVVQVAAGTYFNVALTADGGVTSWGSDPLADAFTNPPGLTNLVQVAAGAAHAVGLRIDSTVVAWGDDSSGQCDVPQNLTNVVQVAAGANHCLALTADGTVVTWGENGLHQCDVPRILTNAFQISAGAVHSLALAPRIPQRLGTMGLPAFVNFSNTTSLNVLPPKAFYSSYTLAGSPTNLESGLPVSVTLQSGPAVLTNSTLTFTGTGTVVISSDQAGNGLFLPARSQTSVVATVPNGQSLVFSGPLTVPFTTSPVPLSGTSSSGLPVSYSVGDPAIAGIGAGNLLLAGIGTTSITASQGGNYTNTLVGDVSGYWLPAAPVTQTLIVTRGNQGISWSPMIRNHPLGATLSLSNLAASSSGLPVSITLRSGPAILDGNSLTLTGGGTVTLAANQSGNANFLPAPEASASFEVLTPKNQAITFASLSAIPYAKDPVPLGATSESGLPVTFSVVDTNIATVSGTNLILRGVGTTTVIATQSGNFSGGGDIDVSQFWFPATPVTNTLIVSKGNQTLPPFPFIPPISSTLPFSLNSLTNMSASSGLIVYYRVVSGNATISNNELIPSLNKKGVVVLAAYQSGSFLYNPAPEVTTSITVLMGQSIAPFAKIKDLGFKPNLTIAVKTPLSSSKLPVTMSVLSGPAYFTAKGLSITNGGTVTLAADQAGDTNYVAAPRVTTSFVVKPAAQILGKITLKNVVFGVAPILIPTPSASTGLPVTVSLSSNSLSIADLVQGTNSSLLTIKGAGTVTVTAVQSGNNSYLPVTNSVSFAVARAPQSISAFPLISNVPLSSKSLTIQNLPVASSKLPLVISVKSGPAIPGPLTNGTVTFTNRGTITLSADQPGNQNYLPAKQVLTSFKVQ
jgi:hypothetical protein